eukprot:tig00020830_g14418.t1
MNPREPAKEPPKRRENVFAKLSERSITAVSWLLFFAAIVWLLLLPFASRRTRTDENALLVNAAEYSYDEGFAQLAEQFLEEIDKAVVASFPDPPNDYVIGTVARALRTAGAEVTSIPVNGPVECGPALIGRIRSRSGDGKEAIALSARYYHHRPDPEESSANNTLEGLNTGAAIAISVAELAFAKHRTWLAMDVIVILHDGSSPACPNGVKAFLDAYHCTGLDCANSLGLRRSGLIRAALALDFTRGTFDRIAVSADGIGGRLPNLDVIATLNEVLVNERRVVVWPYPAQNAAPEWFVKAAIPLWELVLSVDHPLVVPVMEVVPATYWERMVSTLGFAARLALGLPTGDHAHFLMRTVDSFTLSPAEGLRTPSVRDMHIIGRTAEGYIRSINNLLERLHHSSHFYLLSTPPFYVPFAHLSVLGGLLLAVPAVHVVWLASKRKSGLNMYLTGNLLITAAEESRGDPGPAPLGARAFCAGAAPGGPRPSPRGGPRPFRGARPPRGACPSIADSALLFFFPPAVFKLRELSPRFALPDAQVLMLMAAYTLLRASRMLSQGRPPHVDAEARFSFTAAALAAAAREKAKAAGRDPDEHAERAPFPGQPVQEEEASALGADDEARARLEADWQIQLGHDPSFARALALTHLAITLAMLSFYNLALGLAAMLLLVPALAFARPAPLPLLDPQAPPPARPDSNRLSVLWLALASPAAALGLLAAYHDALFARAPFAQLVLDTPLWLAFTSIFYPVHSLLCRLAAGDV